MSSILDALRKLEEEKAHQTVAPRPVEPPRKPAPRRSRSRRPARSRRHTQERNWKIWLAAPVAIFALGLIWAAWSSKPRSDSSAGEQELIAVANVAPAELEAPVPENDPVKIETKIDRIEADLRVAAGEPVRRTGTSIRQDNLSAPIQSAEFEPAPVRIEPASPVVVPEPPRVEVIEAPVLSNSQQEFAVASIAPIQVDVSPVPMETAREPEPEVLPEMEPPVEAVPEPVEMPRVETRTSEPEPETFEVAAEQPRAPEPSDRYRKAMAVSEALRGGTPLEKEPEVAVDIRRYAIMTRTVRARFGIPELDINMLMQPNERHPRPSALINYNNVYIGETIPDTNGLVHLIGVDIRGIAVEVNGERFYYPK